MKFQAVRGHISGGTDMKSILAILIVLSLASCAPVIQLGTALVIVGTAVEEVEETLK